MTENYAHIVLIDKESRLLTIERLYVNGRREMFTTVMIPDASSEIGREAIDKFALELGENLLLDSPSARELLGL